MGKKIMSFQQDCLKEINTDNLDIINIDEEDIYSDGINYDNYEIAGGNPSSDEELGDSNSSDEQLDDSNSSDKKLGESSSSDKQLGESSSSDKQLEEQQNLISSDLNFEEISLDDSEDERDEEGEETELELLNIGDKIRIICEKSSNKLNNKEGHIIFKSNFLLSFRNFALKETYSIELFSGRLSSSQDIKQIKLLDKNKSSNYLFWKDIQVGNNIKINSDNEYNDVEGTVVKNISNKITINFDDKEPLILDLSQGIPPDTKIYDIEKIDSVFEEEDVGIEILEDIELQDIMEAVPIPEEERLYSNQEEFNDIFEQLISKKKNRNINQFLENEIKRSIEMLLKLKHETTIYSKKTGQIEKVLKKKTRFKPLCSEILKNNYHNISYIPIVSDKKKNIC